jgi:hypothetical protein
MTRVTIKASGKFVHEYTDDSQYEVVLEQIRYAVDNKKALFIDNGDSCIIIPVEEVNYITVKK